VLLYTVWLGTFIIHYFTNPGYDRSQWMWFCYVGLVLLGVGFWLDSPLILSWQAVSLVLPQLVFNLDVSARLVLGHHLFENWTEYIFDPEVNLTHRLLSWFHTPMPFVLLWAVWRLGYDRRAIYWQVGACWVILLLSFYGTSPLNNVNYVYGPGKVEPRAGPTVLMRQAVATQGLASSAGLFGGLPQAVTISEVGGFDASELELQADEVILVGQTWTSPVMYLIFCMVAYPLLAYLPVHLALCAIMPRRRDRHGPRAPAAGPRPPDSATARVADGPPSGKVTMAVKGSEVHAQRHADVQGRPKPD
jgi:hypothetical protein